MSAPLLQFDAIEKGFFGVRVLRGVSFEVPAGRIVGLVGENGAGKSTLMNILGGNLRPDRGRVLLEGQPFEPRDARDAEAGGIAFIHQELNLFPNLTIAENLFLASPPRTALGLIDRAGARRRAAELLGEVGLAHPPDTLVEQLSSGERQLLEIAKAVSLHPRLIIFDEPTTSLSVSEIERLFALIERLRGRGIAMIYISHALADVFRLCDSLVVLRDGEVVGAGPTPEFTTDRLVSLMVGREMSQLFPVRRGAPGTEPMLEVRDLRRPGQRSGVSFTLRRGEVLGLSGLMGTGRSELVRVLFGLDPAASGEVLLAGRPLSARTPRELIASGVAFLTENRRSEGLLLEAGVDENLSLAVLPEHSTGLSRWIRASGLADAVASVRTLVQLDRKAGPRQPVRTLSGGNQQKIVLGKWLLCRPRVLILDEPTRGIDVGAKYEIYRLIHQLADGGSAVFVISSEMEELMGLCDRILVMRQGALVDDLARSDFDRERILSAALGAAPSRA